MEFIEFREKLIENFNKMTQNAENLFEVEVDKDELWNLYLDSFPKGTNKMYRKRREFDCGCCRHFVKTIGNAVVIEDGIAKSIWDFELGDDVYQPVINTLNKYIKGKVVTNVYYHYEKNVGTEFNYEVLKGTDIKKWEHFYLILPSKFIRNKFDIPTARGNYKTQKDVFKRSLEEISEDSISTVLELISQGSLYKGNEWKAQLESLLEYNKKYKLTPSKNANNWLWINSIEAGAVVARIKNHSIGTLLMDITNNVELDVAIKKYEAIVAPSNYKRPNAIYTKKMLDKAKKELGDLGYLDSLPRRFATIDDITVNNVLFVNKDISSQMNSLDVFDEMEKDVAVNPKKLSKIEEVSIDKFVNDVLPLAKELGVLFENKHTKNLVSLIAPKNKEAKSLFKWNNPFGWAYTGNLADSQMKKNVAKAGGKIDGVLRFSIQWNELDDYNCDDYDCHCKTPSGEHICFRNETGHKSTGMLDVDIMRPERNKPAVENITFTDVNKMPKGTYRMFVNNYSNRGGKSGFRAEIEFNGEIYSFEYNKSLRDGEDIPVAEVYFDGTTFSLTEKLPVYSSVSSKKAWNLNTSQFVPVTVVSKSPNAWDGQCVGNEHVFFMLKDCINPECPRSMFNEFLVQELDKHKRVMEALGEKLSVVDADSQLSGIGFSLTRRNDLIVKVTGSTRRIIKIKI